MSVIAEGFKIGNLTLSKKYTMTKLEMESIGAGEDYPDVFPIWCTDDNCLYIFYKTTDDKANIANINSLVPSDTAVVLYPTVNEETSELSWEFKTIDSTVPDPVVLKGKAGDSSYQTWLNLGNVGTEQDFINSLKGDFSTMTDSDIDKLKVALGFDKLEQTIVDINTLLDEINDVTSSQ